MKKIGKYLFLLVICFLPVMVDAKAYFEFKAEIKNQILLEINNGNYTFINLNVIGSEDGSVLVYNSKGDLVLKTSIMPENDEDFNDEDFNEMLRLPYFIKFLSFMFDAEGVPFTILESYIYGISYNNESIFFVNTETEEEGEFKFSDNIELTRKLLGKKYDVYLEAKKTNNMVINIKEYNGYYIVYYQDDIGDFVSIMDENYKIIKTFESLESYDYAYYVYDDLIYILKNCTDLEIYKIDGSLYQTFKIGSDKFDDNTNFDGMYPKKMIIEDSRLFVIYANFNHLFNARIIGDDVKDFTFGEGENDDFLTMVYDLNFDIEKVESSNGEFTYESKVDEDGKKYMELMIIPKKGYSVEKIIVTDVNGKEIKVTNNKFYRPLNDIKIEVKYVKGEYLPIPDTFLGKSLTLIFIGLVLVGLGFYTINYVRGDSKVDI